MIRVQSLAQYERAQLTDLLDKVGRDAPTLCDGWTSADLAAHLWVRETDPIGAAGIVVAPMAAITEKRMARARERFGYSELVDQIRRGPGRFSAFNLPGMDEQANAIEYWVHHEDVRRAGDAPAEPRPSDPETEDRIWRHLKLAGKMMLRSAPVGIVLERSDHPGATLRVVPGEETVTLVGLPTELLLFAFGRRSVAKVEAIGEPAALEAFERG